MKKNKYFFPVIGFIAGMVFGISIIGLFAFTNGPASGPPTGGITAITTTVANGYLNNYLSKAVSLNQVVKGFTIDKIQLDAMNSIAAENTNLSGFRIYMGKDNNANSVGMVVGVDNLGLDAVKNSIFVTASQRLSPCPPICDVSSPIILGN